MPDQIDQAKDIEAMQRADALARHNSNKIIEEPTIIDGLRCCEGCLDVITEQRLNAQPTAVRCVCCQQVEDERNARRIYG